MAAAGKNSLQALFGLAFTLACLGATIALAAGAGGRRQVLGDLVANLERGQAETVAAFVESAHRASPDQPLVLAQNLQSIITALARESSEVLEIALLDTNGRALVHSEPRRLGEYYLAPFSLQELLVQGRPFFTMAVLEGQAQALYARRLRFIAYEEERQQPPPFEQRLAIAVTLDASEAIGAQERDRRAFWLYVGLLGLLGVASAFFIGILRSSQALAESRAALENYASILVDSLSSAVVSLDGEHRIVSLNRLAKDLFQQEEPRTLDELLPDEANARLRATITNNLRIRQETVVFHRGEEELPLGLRVHEVISPEGEGAGKVVIFEDEREIAELKSQVQRSERLASLGRMASMIAHEVRNPLSIIQGHVGVLRGNLGGEASGEALDKGSWDRALHFITGEIERLNRVVGELVHFAQPLHLELAPTDVNALVGETLEFMRSDAEYQNIRLEEILDSTIPLVPSDEGKLKQVLLNMYLNAFDAMEGGGTLTVQTLYQPFRNRWSLSIEDTGSGISEEHLNALFDPYFTTKKKGAGLGLSIVHNTVETLKGTIQVTSEVGEGTTFVLTFPVA